MRFFCMNKNIFHYNLKFFRISGYYVTFLFAVESKISTVLLYSIIVDFTFDVDLGFLKHCVFIIVVVLI